MKVPFPANNHTTSKPLVNCTINTTRSTPLPATPYEPKSVLELRRSPSPVAEKPDSITTTTVDIWPDHLQLDDHVLINPQLEDWDSLMRDLGLHDDLNPVAKPSIQLNSQPDPQITQNQYPSNLPEFPQVNSFDSDFELLYESPGYASSLNQNVSTIGSIEGLSGDLNNSNWNVGFEFVDELIRLAECFEANSLQLGHVILARLNQRLTSPSGKPLQRAAFYFKEALQSLLTGSTRTTHQPANSFEIVQTIRAQKTFASISPIPMFCSFTANQAVLEALDSSLHVHVIDFDIGLGGHWASFMKELADKADARKEAPPVLRISAVVPEEYATEPRLITENLTQFARELNIRFDIDFVSMRTFEYLSFKSIKFVEDEKVAVILSRAIFRHVGTGFLNDLRRVSPQVVVHVDIDGQLGFATTSYRQAVIDGLEFYSTLLESLEAANFNGAGVGDWMRKIETFVLYPKIMEVVDAAGRRETAWREALVAAGLRQVGLSQFSEFQAECLLRRVQVRGFHVVKRQAEMMLCWHDRLLVSTSAWRC